jgi:SHS2 domain-containing protein
MDDGKSGFEFLEHPADIWVHAWGPTRELAFEQCVHALTKTMTDPDLIIDRIEKTIELEDQTLGSLLVAFLTEFLFLFDTEYLIFKSVTVTKILQQSSQKWTIQAIARGEPFDPTRHFQDTEVKAITYSYLQIEEKNNRVDIKIVYDI